MTTAPDPSSPLGLIAGEGLFPVLVARGAKAAGRRVACVAFTGIASPDLAGQVDTFAWSPFTRPSRWIRLLRAAGCREVIMVGRVKKSRSYDRFLFWRSLPDLRAVRLWYGPLRHDKRPQTVLRVISEEFAAEGFTVIDSTQYCTEHLASPGVMTRRQPTAEQWQDIHFAWDRCSTLGRLDIGQAIAVRNREVIAVEALEGTDLMIQRAGQLCKTGGWVLVKVANAVRDLRLDVPTIGAVTIEHLHAAGAACVVLDPGTTIILDKEKVLQLADRLKIAVVGYQGPKT